MTTGAFFFAPDDRANQPHILRFFLKKVRAGLASVERNLPFPGKEPVLFWLVGGFGGEIN
jgi:hypothetical protein